jgi:hypothetical protein
VDRNSRRGNPNFRCQTDPAHRHSRYRSWTRKLAGKTDTRRLTDEQLKRYGDWLDNDRRLRALVSELEALSIDVANRAEGSGSSS